jgi:hypothetical protein
MKIKKRYLSALVLFIIGGILFTVYFFDEGINEKESFNTFMEVTRNDQLNDVVIKLQRPDRYHKNCPTTINLIFKDYRKVKINTIQERSEGIAISMVTDVGDRILKHAGSDTVYIFKYYSKKETFDYFFLLEE